MKGFFRKNMDDVKVRFGTERKMYAVILFGFLCMSLITAFPAKKDTSEKTEEPKEEKKVSVEGNIEKTEYIVEGLLQRFVQKTKKGNIVFVEYFDGEGNPEKQLGDYYALLQEQDEEKHDIKISYLGIDKQPINTAWGYGIIMCTYDEEGHMESEQYFNKNGAPVITDSGYHEIVYRYENGKNVMVNYLDDRGNLVLSQSGYAILRRIFYEEEPIAGKVAYEYYFDERDKPVVISQGQCGIHKVYDEKGRLVTITYLGADGKPIMCNLGYAMMKRTYYENGSIDTETYYDEKGHPVALSLGQYGTKRVNGKMIYIDSNGREMFRLRNHLSGHLCSVIVAALLIAALSVLNGKKGNIFFLVLFLLCIAYMTLLYREEVSVKSRIEPFWAYRHFFSSLPTRINIINNIWLFFPLGTILFRLSQRRRDVVIAVLISIGIELLQYVTGVGTAESDDVISNGLGALLGMWFGYILLPYPIRKLQQEEILSR